ncbi:UNVERIFIED_CONTAM: hypothetical protein GTU68_038797 [Idotea baltica]|nr:hypothetical protein [Idotea baltica]
MCEITVSGAPFTELSATGVTKALGLTSIASKLGFTAANTIVFGDNQNDLPMFEWAGQSVAMGNATEELKAVASAITLSNREHGVAHFLSQQMDAGLL